MLPEEEAYKIKVASDPFVFEESVYFTMNWIEDDEYRSSIYSYDGTELQRITFGGHEKRPVFHGKTLYYISYNEDKETLMVIEQMKEPRAIFSNKSISKFVFHGDTILAMTNDKTNSENPIVTSKLKYRYDTKGFLRSRTKLVALKESPEVLVSGDFDVVDVETNGKKVVISATIEDDDRGLEDVYELNLSDKSLKKLTSGKGYAGSVCVTADGTVAYLGHRKEQSPWASYLLVFPELGKEILVGNTAENTVNSDLFISGDQSMQSDHKTIYLIGEEGPSSFLYSYKGKVSRLTEDKISVRSFHVNNGKVAYTYTSPERPSVLVFKNELNLNPDVEGISPKRIENNGIEGWLMLAGKEKPTVLSVHGGPQTAYGYSYFIEFNYLVNNGFNVLYCNPRGSSGYGEEFAKGCIGDWGGEDFKDILGFMDKAIKEYDLSGNFGITGGSYGGFMTNIAITKSDRFKCAISERCVSNLMSMCGTSDIGFWFNAIEAGVEDPWSKEGIEKLLQMSPISMVKNVKTPTMFIHGEEDYRCPTEQSEQMYTGLKMNGVDSVLVRYPGDSHEHARHGIPKNMKDRLRRKKDWFNKYLNSKSE